MNQSVRDEGFCKRYKHIEEHNEELIMIGKTLLSENVILGREVISYFNVFLAL